MFAKETLRVLQRFDFDHKRADSVLFRVEDANRRAVAARPELARERIDRFEQLLSPPPHSVLVDCAEDDFTHRPNRERAANARTQLLREVDVAALVGPCQTRRGRDGRPDSYRDFEHESHVNQRVRWFANSRDRRGRFSCFSQRSAGFRRNTDRSQGRRCVRRETREWRHRDCRRSVLRAC